MAGQTQIDFDEPMVRATDDQLVVTDFTLPILGHFWKTSLVFHRDGNVAFNMSTADITFVEEGDHVRIKISTWDRTVDNVNNHRYRVSGTLYLLV